MAAVKTGAVKWFNEDKGFGFIEPDDGDKDVFLHVSALKKAGLATVKGGDRVTFMLEDSKKSGRKQATNIKLMDGA